MPKALNVIILTVFIMMVSLAAYGSPSRAHQNFAQNPEERDISGQEFQEDILPYVATNFFMKTIVQDLIFPTYIALKPQLVSNDVSKPPLA